MRKNHVFDLRISHWGHMVERAWGQSDNCKVHGCLTPLPKPGDYVLAKNNYFYKVLTVEAFGNPKDEFSAKLEETGVCGTEDVELPTYDELNKFIDELNKFIHDKNSKTINGEPCKIVPPTSKDHKAYHNMSKDEPIVKFGQFSKYKKGLI